MSSSHDRVSPSGVFYHPSSLLSSFCTTASWPHGGDVSLFAHWEISMNWDWFLHRNRVYFLILCNENQILSLLAEWSGEGVPCTVCLYVYLFCFLITCAFTSQRLWTDEPFLHFLSVTLSIHSSVPLSFKTTNATSATRWKNFNFLICVSAACDVLSTKCFFLDPNWKVSYAAYTVAFSINDKGTFKGHPRMARQIEPPILLWAVIKCPSVFILPVWIHSNEIK